MWLCLQDLLIFADHNTELRQLLQSQWQHGVYRKMPFPKRFPVCNYCFNNLEECDAGKSCGPCTSNEVACIRKKCSFYEQPDWCDRQDECNEAHVSDGYDAPRLSNTGRDVYGADVAAAARLLQDRVAACDHCAGIRYAPVLCIPIEGRCLVCKRSACESCMYTKCSKFETCKLLKCRYLHHEQHKSLQLASQEHQERGVTDRQLPHSTFTSEDVAQVSEARGIATHPILAAIHRLGANYEEVTDGSMLI